MIKVMEYMALERPIVAYDLPETRVSAGESALDGPPNDPRAFASALALLAGDPRGAARWAQQGAAASRRAWPGATRCPRCCGSTRTSFPRPSLGPATRCRAPSGGRPADMIHPSALVECTTWAGHPRLGVRARPRRTPASARTATSAATATSSPARSSGPRDREERDERRAGVTLADDVFVGPAVVFTNDLRRAPRARGLAGSRYDSYLLAPTDVRRGATIGAGACRRGRRHHRRVRVRRGRCGGDARRRPPHAREGQSGAAIGLRLPLRATARR